MYWSASAVGKANTSIRMAFTIVRTNGTLSGRRCNNRKDEKWSAQFQNILPRLTDRKNETHYRTALVIPAAKFAVGVACAMFICLTLNNKQSNNNQTIKNRKYHWHAIQRHFRINHEQQDGINNVNKSVMYSTNAINANASPSALCALTVAGTLNV